MKKTIIASALIAFSITAQAGVKEKKAMRAAEEAATIKNLQEYGFPYADADHVIIRMVASYPNIILRIEDDGKGFDVEGSLLKASSEKRMGLGSMEERVSLLDGNLRIQSRLLEGTKIRIEIPLKEKAGA